MQIKEFEKFVRQMMNSHLPEKDIKASYALGLVGEFGEILETVNGKSETQYSDFGKEGGDFMHYLVGFCALYGMDAESVIYASIGRAVIKNFYTLSGRVQVQQFKNKSSLLYQISDMVKKDLFHVDSLGNSQKPIDKQKCESMLIEILSAFCPVVAHMGSDLNLLMEGNVEKLKARHPSGGFTAKYQDANNPIKLNNGGNVKDIQPGTPAFFDSEGKVYKSEPATHKVPYVDLTSKYLADSVNNSSRSSPAFDLGYGKSEIEYALKMPLIPTVLEWVYAGVDWATGKDYSVLTALRTKQFPGEPLWIEVKNYDEKAEQVTPNYKPQTFPNRMKSVEGEYTTGEIRYRLEIESDKPITLENVAQEMYWNKPPQKKIECDYDNRYVHEFSTGQVNTSITITSDKPITLDMIAIAAHQERKRYK